MFSFSLNIALPLPFISHFSLSSTSSAPSKAQSNSFSIKLPIFIPYFSHTLFISFDVGTAIIFKCSFCTFSPISIAVMYDVVPEPNPMVWPSFTLSNTFFAKATFASLFSIFSISIVNALFSLLFKLVFELLFISSLLFICLLHINFG